MGAIGLLNQLYREKTLEYSSELEEKSKLLAKKNEKKMYKETPLREIESEKKKLETKISSIKAKYETGEHAIKQQLKRAIGDKKVEIEAKIISATKKEATDLVLEFQKWWPKL